MHPKIKALLPHVVAIVSFVILSSVYFSPVFDGYTLIQGDADTFQGMSREIDHYRTTNEEEPLWTNSMFGGMPAYQISVVNKNNWLSYIDQTIKMGLPKPVAILFTTMLGFYIFALCVGVNPWIGILGAIGYGFSTIHILYIGAGHITKINAVAYIAPTVGGFILAFRKKLLLGVAVFSLFLGLNLMANHFQMTYYLAWLLVAVGLGEAARLLVFKEFKSLGKTIAFLLIGVVLAILPNLTNLTSTLEYSKHTTRGKTDLTIEPNNKKKEQTTQKGLNKDYILEYNYGKGELLSLIIPNARGEKDGYLGDDEKLMETIDPEFTDQVAQMNRYWGGQRMSGGAFYFGVVMFVFCFFGFLFYKDPLKWSFLGLFLIAITLALKEADATNDFFINHFPMYSKFRDSKMILVLVQFMVPALGVVFLDRFLFPKSTSTDLAPEKRSFFMPKGLSVKKKPLLIASGVLIFLGVLLYLSPSISGSFIKSEETKMFADAFKGAKDKPEQIEYFKGLKKELINARISVFKSDVGRFIFYCFIACALIFSFAHSKISKYLFIGIALIAVLFDNIGVSKRYLNNKENEDGGYKSYIEASIGATPGLAQKADLFILKKEKGSIVDFNKKSSMLNNKMLNHEPYNNIEEEESLNTLADFGVLSLNSNFRVLHLNNPFNESNTSYYHKSIGGYHGAKLKRYQELIDFYIFNEIQAINSQIGAKKNEKINFYMRDPQFASIRSLPEEQQKKQMQLIYDTISIQNIKAETPILNMLNTKYVVTNKGVNPVENSNKNGNCWFVEKLKPVGSANKEMLALKEINLKNEAVVPSSQIKKSSWSKTNKDSIYMTKYGTNNISYSSVSKSALPAIFSEVYYPDGWNCYVDGKKVETFRANYVLRGAIIPAGKHKIEWKFEPQTFYTSSAISLIGSILLFLGCGFIFGSNAKKRFYPKA